MLKNISCKWLILYIFLTGPRLLSPRHWYLYNGINKKMRSIKNQHLLQEFSNEVPEVTLSKELSRGLLQLMRQFSMSCLYSFFIFHKLIQSANTSLNLNALCRCFPGRVFKNKHKKAVAKRCSVKNMFLQILPNSQESTCGRASFLKRDSRTDVFL